MFEWFVCRPNELKSQQAVPQPPAAQIVENYSDIAFEYNSRLAHTISGQNNLSFIIFCITSYHAKVKSVLWRTCYLIQTAQDIR